MELGELYDSAVDKIFQWIGLEALVTEDACPVCGNRQTLRVTSGALFWKRIERSLCSSCDLKYFGRAGFFVREKNIKSLRGFVRNIESGKREGEA